MAHSPLPLYSPSDSYSSDEASDYRLPSDEEEEDLICIPSSDDEYELSDDAEADDGSLDDDFEAQSEEEVHYQKIIKLLASGQDLDVLKLEECKAYLRKHGLRLTGTKAVCMERILEHWRIKDGNGQELYPRSSFVINCRGDVCTGDVVLFTQRIYEKFDKIRSGGAERPIGHRTVAGRVVKESYGAHKQQHTFTVEVLWSTGLKRLPPLFPLLVKGRNLYRLKTFRQACFNILDVVVLSSIYACFRQPRKPQLRKPPPLRENEATRRPINPGEAPVSVIVGKTDTVESAHKRKMSAAQTLGKSRPTAQAPTTYVNNNPRGKAPVPAIVNNRGGKTYTVESAHKRKMSAAQTLRKSRPTAQSPTTYVNNHPLRTRCLSGFPSYDNYRVHGKFALYAPISNNHYEGSTSNWTPKGQPDFLQRFRSYNDPRSYNAGCYLNAGKRPKNRRMRDPVMGVFSCSTPGCRGVAVETCVIFGCAECCGSVGRKCGVHQGP
ncbi:hypothetical protein AMTRI_Chr04g246880 [Amborella trichopoda]